MRELRERVERLGRQNQELQEKEAKRNEEEGKNKQDGANAATDAAGKKPDAETKWVEVGSDLRLNGIWDNGLYFLTPNKDWEIHIGGRFRPRLRDAGAMVLLTSKLGTSRPGRKP